MVPQEKVSKMSLRDLLGHDEIGTKYFREAKTLVEAHLFSRFDWRKKFAVDELSRLLGKLPVEVHTLNHSDDIYTYLKFNKIEEYVHVKTYNKNCRLLEIAPSENEINFFNKR